MRPPIVAFILSLNAIPLFKNVFLSSKMLNFQMVVNSLLAAGLVHSYLALSKMKEALYAAREAMKAMPHSAKALKLVGDVHASNSGGREKVHDLNIFSVVIQPLKTAICK